MVWIKGIVENGWYLHNPAVGAPDGLDMRDFPLAESTHFAIFKMLAWFTRDVALIHNLYYLLGFPLAALSSLLVLRHFRVSYFPALAVSVLFAFLPYHFLRLTHLFLAAYYLIPLLVMIILWVYLGRLPFFRCDEGQKSTWQLFSGKTLAAILICVLIGSGGIYYAFFGCFLLLVAGAAGSLERKNFYALGSALALVAIIAGTALCNIAPHIAYVMQHGANSEAGRRYHYENEMYGLRIVQMLLPVMSHRIGGFANMRARLLAGGDQPLCLEDGQRLPDRGPADVELRGELDLARQRPTLMPHAGDNEFCDFARNMGVGLAEFCVPGQTATLKHRNILSALLRRDVN